MIKKFVVALIAITLMIVSIAVWFVLPSDTWLWAQVTTSITTFVVLVVMAVWLYQWRNKQRANSDVHEQHVLLKQDTKVIQELFKLAAKKIRGHGTNKLESLYNLPWYSPRR